MKHKQVRKSGEDHSIDCKCKLALVAYLKYFWHQNLDDIVESPAARAQNRHRTSPDEQLVWRSKMVHII